MKLLSTTLAVIFAFLTIPASGSELPPGQKVDDLPWNWTPQLHDSTGLQLSRDELTVANDPLNALTVTCTKNEGADIPLRSVPWEPDPSYRIAITTHHYAITGEVRYENVASGSYLEMWSYFDSPAPGYPEGAYFSRTMADGGLMGRLEGTSGWREFWLPFDSTGTKSPLNRLEMNLHLTGPGTVHFRKMKLMQYPDAGAVATATTGQNPPLATVSNEPVSTTLYVGYDATNKPVWNLGKVDYSSLDALQAALKNKPITRLDIHADQRVTKSEFNALLQACSQGGVQFFGLNGGPASSIAQYFDAMPPKSLADFAIGNPETSPDKPHRVTLDVSAGDATGVQIRYDGASYTSATLGDAVKTGLTADPRTAFVIRADKSVPYKAITTVLDALKAANAANVYFATQPTSDSANAPAPNPSADAPPAATPENPVVLKVTQANDGAHITVDDKEVPLSGLSSLIADQLKANHDVHFVIKARRDVPYDSIHAILDQFRSANAGNVGLSVDPDLIPKFAPLAGHPSPGLFTPIDWRSFGLGALSTPLVALACAALFFLARQFRGLRHARELRRIAAMDV